MRGQESGVRLSVVASRSGPVTLYSVNSVVRDVSKRNLAATLPKFT